MGQRRILLGTALGLVGSLAIASAAFGQAPAPSPAIAAVPTEGSLGLLPLGEQKIARAVWEAQIPPSDLTVDEIASIKLSGQSWGEIFADFIMREVVTQKRVEQIMQRYTPELAEAVRVKR